MDFALHARASRSLRCSICHGPLAEGSGCPRCRVRFHRDCREELRRCPSLGCGGGEPEEPRPIRAPRPRSRVSAILLSILAFVTIVASLAAPPILEARKRGNEAQAISALKRMATSEAWFLGDHPTVNSEYATLAELEKTDLIDSPLRGPRSQFPREVLWFTVWWEPPCVLDPSVGMLFYVSTSSVVSEAP